MSSNWSSRVLKRYVPAAAALVVLLCAATAFAIGRVQWEETSVKPLSDGDSWRLKMSVHLPKAPDFANMPVKFEFLPTVYFERSLVDGDKELMREVPLTGRQPLVESVEMGFLDPSSGEIQKRTRFTFKLRRDRGYDAGKYRVTLKDGRTGNTIGTPTNITLEGENEVIDRRTMDFSAKPREKKEEKRKEESSEAASPDPDEASTQSSEDAEPAAGTDDYESYGEEEEDAPGEIQEKPGACGCRAAGGRAGSGGLLSSIGLLLAFAAAGRLKRRG